MQNSVLQHDFAQVKKETCVRMHPRRPIGLRAMPREGNARSSDCHACLHGFLRGTQALLKNIEAASSSTSDAAGQLQAFSRDLLASQQVQRISKALQQVGL